MTLVRLQRFPLGWIALAVLAGIAVAVLPISVSLPGLAILALCVLSLIDLRVALVATLTIAPLKTLLETETHLMFDVGQLALLATLGIWIARNIADRRRLDLVWTPMLIPLMLFTFAASLSLFVSLSPAGTITELAKWVEMIVVIALAVSLSRDYGVGWIAAAVVFAAVVQAIIGIYQFYGGSGAPPLWILDFTRFRAFGSFGQPNPFGAYMGLTLPLALSVTTSTGIETWTLLRSDQRNLMRISGLRCVLFAIGTAIIAYGLYVSWSRGAWIGFLAALGVMLLFAPRRPLIGFALMGVLAIGGLGAWAAGVLPASVVARISDFSQEFAGFGDIRGLVITDANYAVLERLAHWQAAIGMANDSPWLGVGFGDYEVAYPRYQLMNWRFPLGHAHNYYLNLLAETGIIGLIGYIVAWLMIFALTLRVLYRTKGLDRGIALGLLGTWVHLAVHSIFDKLYVNNLYLHLGVMLGLIGYLVINSRNSHDSI